MVDDFLRLSLFMERMADGVYLFIGKIIFQSYFS
jgi:hypothetical protein